jgi:hypothetical protein
MSLRAGHVSDFVGIPPFIDGRAELYKRAFILHRYDAFEQGDSRRCWRSNMAPIDICPAAAGNLAGLEVSFPVDTASMLTTW